MNPYSGLFMFLQSAITQGLLLKQVQAFQILPSTVYIFDFPVMVQMDQLWRYIVTLNFLIHSLLRLTSRDLHIWHLRSHQSRMLVSRYLLPEANLLVKLSRLLRYKVKMLLDAM